jgi:hypothetical protein
MLSCFVLAAQAGRRGRTPLVSRTSAGHTGFEPAASTLTGWHSNLTELMPRGSRGRIRTFTVLINGQLSCLVRPREIKMPRFAVLFPVLARGQPSQPHGESNSVPGGENPGS